MATTGFDVFSQITYAHHRRADATDRDDEIGHRDRLESSQRASDQVVRPDAPPIPRRREAKVAQLARMAGRSACGLPDEGRVGPDPRVRRSEVPARGR